MDLHVKENDELGIKKVQMTCDGKNKDIHPIIPNYNSCTLLIGSAGSGKTTLLLNFLCNRKIWRKKFQTVHIFSPSFHTVKKTFHFRDGGIIPTFDVAKMKEILTKLESEHDSENKTLIIFDDVCGRLKREKEAIEPLERFVLNRRHLGGGVTLLFTAQKYNLIPLEIRNNSTHLILFNGVNRERENIYKEWSNLDKDEWDKMNRFVYASPHTFLYIRRDQDEYDGKYFKNFDKILGLK